MKYLTPLTVVLTPLLFVGCSSTSPLTIKEHGAPIAQSIGSDVTDLKFVSPGDFAAFEELTDGFDPSTKGMVALTESSLFWRDGQGDLSAKGAFREIPLDTITGAALDSGVLQIRIGDQLHVLRLTQWNPYQSSPQQTQQFLQILRGRNIPEFEVKASIVQYPVKRQPFSRQDPVFMGYVPVTDGDGNTTHKWTVIPGDGTPPR